MLIEMYENGICNCENVLCKSQDGNEVITIAVDFFGDQFMQ